ncbi:hypothetical protein FA15DRAFT_649986 [Coprinopsis marcescibilis]|uniref:Uncharacterized protein n=1 Tax=Coprinopsis marcescibilis TaxID=230819 RepID=A0A5C3KE22_COPMA|nr:hypothetical protein FA15DRAFT_649986 [Coprinopsis marcescibilis]
MGANISTLTSQLYVIHAPQPRASAFFGAKDVNLNNTTVNAVAGDMTHKYYYGCTFIESRALDVDEVIAIAAKWLTDINFRIIHLDNLGKRTPNTGLWIFDREAFDKWLNGGPGVFWGTGMPGAGKTILSSIVIEKLQQLTEGPEVCVVFAYCRYTDSIPIGLILASLLRQMLERSSAVWPYIQPMYERHTREGTRPTHEELFDVLKRISCSGIFSKLIVAVDGLDEAAGETQVDIMAAISQLPYIVPHASFMDITAYNPDLMLPIQEKFGKIPALRQVLKSNEHRSLLVSKILEKSAGMFLLASLQLDLLKLCTNFKSFEQALERLPTGVDEMYAITMRRIETLGEANASIAKHALMWLTYARSSLLIQELCQAVAIGPDTYEFDKALLVDNETLLSMCCGLVTFEEGSGLVRLVHYTASDFLKPYLARDFPDPHALIATTCVARLFQYGLHDFEFEDEEAYPYYLEEDDYEEFMADIFSPNPLLEYAYTNWHSHSHSSNTLPPHTVQFVRRCRQFPYLNTTDEGCLIDKLSSIHVATVYNFQLLLSSWLENRERLVGALLAVQGLNINAFDDARRTALTIASEAGAVQTVLQLLQVEGIRLNIVDQSGTTPLGAAVRSNRLEVVQVLLAVQGVDVNLAGSEAATPLIQAARSEHISIDIAKLLLQHRSIDINATTSDGRTALDWAVEEENTEVEGLLRLCGARS